eukprot:Pompholyxophrys_punicea_v1_NODE_260_length_2503_cov_15.998366.p2 type:complete len:160 gc:universal NODE_260_length_2503_cov_15.998366:577-98(-)
MTPIRTKKSKFIPSPELAKEVDECVQENKSMGISKLTKLVLLLVFEREELARSNLTGAGPLGKKKLDSAKLSYCLGYFPHLCLLLTFFLEMVTKAYEGRDPKTVRRLFRQSVTGKCKDERIRLENSAPEVKELLKALKKEKTKARQQMAQTESPSESDD